jgi:glycosyltransferase involved in cell wall biosynthesis
MPIVVVAEPLADQKIVVVTHHDTTGPSDALESYLSTRAASLVVVEHGFGRSVGSGTTLRVWRRGQLVRTRRIPWSARIPGPITWLKDFVLSLLLGQAGGRSDHFVGIDSLNAFAGLWLRAVRRTRRVSFWTIDYAPDRFGNPLLNAVYFALDKRCVEHADETWNVSPRMAEGRERRRVFGRQRVVPMGAYAREPAAAAKPHQAVHMGSLLEKQGVQVAIEALPQLLAVLPDATLLVIGDGPFRHDLEALAERRGVSNAVTFTGYIDDHAEVEQRIAESGVALATYDPEQEDFTAFADPGKIRNYLAAGVPVIATDVPWTAAWLADEGAGVLVRYRSDDVADAIQTLVDDPAARQHAARLGREGDWACVFDAAFDAQRRQTNANE